VCSVPHVKGLKLAKAKKALVKAGCPVGKVRYSRGSKRGRVINQKPNRGKALDAGTKVALTVAR
jgi:beta-lactam-binding protein with PASTA domain